MDVHPADHVKNVLEFQQLQWFDSKWSGATRDASFELLEKEHSIFVKKHNRSVSHSWPPLLHCQRTIPAALLLCVVYLYTVVQRLSKAQTLSVFIDSSLTVYSIFEACRKHTFPSGLTVTSECLCTVLPTVVHLCCTRA